MISKVAFTLYPATDVPRARGFYEGILGLTSGVAGNHGDIWWVEYDLPGGGCLAISNATEGVPSAAAGGMIALEVDDLSRRIEELKARQVEFKGDIVHGPRCRMAVCVDSEGNAILLHQLNPAT